MRRVQKKGVVQAKKAAMTMNSSSKYAKTHLVVCQKPRILGLLACVVVSSTCSACPNSRELDTLKEPQRGFYHLRSMYGSK